MTYPGAHCAQHPDKPAVVMDQSGESVTYRQLEERSTRLANWLHDRGLRRGDVVALLAGNDLRYLEVYWAVIRSGLYLSPINRHLSADEIAYQLNDSGAQVLIATHDLAASAASAAALSPTVTHRLMINGTVDGFAPYEAALDESSPVQRGPMPRGEGLLYSSGTTGRPKGVKKPLPAVDLDSPAARTTSILEEALLGMSRESVYLCPTPLYHGAGLFWSAGVHELGGTLVVMEKFDAERFLALVQRERVTHTQVVPTMLVRLLKLDDDVRGRYDLSSLERVLHAAAPCSEEVKRSMIDWLGPILDEYYSGTEGSGLTFIDAKDWLAHPGSVGKARSGVPHVCDEAGDEVPNGTPGLLYFEQEAAPFEYHHDPEKTRASRHPKHPNWTAVGDVGYVDDEGYVYLTDRQSFMIISGGVNIYPQEIEACLINHEKVLDAAVFGLPDEEMGEFVQAVIQLMPGVEPDADLVEELRAFTRLHLAGYKVPRAVDFREELHRLPTGKLAKGRLRAEYLSVRT